jgi:hypothetical protein
MSVASAAAVVRDTEEPVVSTGACAKKRGRPKASARPKIDIDDEIKEANKIHAIMKKLALAAKAAERNGQRVKQRLVKKASKLNVLDLERIAVLKRCGLLPITGSSSAETSSTETGSSSSDSSPVKVGSAIPAKVKEHMAMALGRLSGGSEILKAIEKTEILPQAAKTKAAIPKASMSVIKTVPLPRALPVVKTSPEVPPLKKQKSAVMADGTEEQEGDEESEKEP